jgi:hypothetical protein
VLPQSIRRFDQSLEGKRLFGKYKATLTLNYGDPQQKIEQSITFWVIPYKLIIIIILLLVALVFGIKFAVSRYNRHIIKKAQSMQAQPPTPPAKHIDQASDTTPSDSDDNDQSDKL